MFYLSACPNVDLLYVLILSEAESASQNVRISVLFDRLMLMELRENVEKLQPKLVLVQRTETSI